MGAAVPIQKAPTGIPGLDSLLSGGFPAGRTTLIAGGAGCGKTLLALEFVVHGALQFGEAAVFVAFEESLGDLKSNAASLGFNLDELIARRTLALDAVTIDRNLMEAAGDYDLEGLFIRLAHAIDAVGAKRVVLDTIETLFEGLPSSRTLRHELQRLFRWLKSRGVTTIITAESGSAPKLATRMGLEEYVSDCVIVLDHRVERMISSRRLRVLKYRGSAHGTNEYPFLIDRDGIAVMPVTALALTHSVSLERIPSGVPALDAMLGGGGFYRGSSILVSGTSGTGKTSLAAHFVNACCRNGQRALYFSFEESESQIMRNLSSIGLDLGELAAKGLLKIQATRPTLLGLEMHLSTMLKHITEFDPQAVVLDPLNSFVSDDNVSDVKLMLLRMLDALKSQNITGFFTNLTSAGSALEHTDVFISSLIDTWILLRDIESGYERNRGLYVLKSRGMMHSNQIREFKLTSHGIEMLAPYIGAAGVLTGSARLVQEAADRAEQLKRDRELAHQQSEIERKRRQLDATIAAMRADFEREEQAMFLRLEEARTVDAQLQEDRNEMARARRADNP